MPNPVMRRRHPYFGFDWTPLQLGADLGAWYRADQLVVAQTAAQVTAATAEALTRAAAGATAFNIGTGDFSLEMWVLADDLTTTRVVWEKGANSGAASGDDGLQVAVQGSANRVDVWFSDGTATRIQLIGSGGIAATGTWYQIVIRGDRDGNLTLRINDAAQGSTAISAQQANADSTRDLTIGAASGGASLPHNGGVGVTRWWSRLLTDAEVTAFYNGGVPRYYASLSTAEKVGLAENYDMREKAGNRSGQHASLTLTDVNTVTARDAAASWGAMDADFLKSWGDLGSGAFDLSQATMANRPAWYASVANGKPVVRIAAGGIERLLRTTGSIAGAQPLSVYVVAKFTGGDTQYDLVGGGVTNDRVLLGKGPGGVGGTFGGSAGTIYGPAYTSDANFHLFSMDYNGGSSQVFVDGTSLGTGAAGANVIDGGIAIGGIRGVAVNGDIAEVLVTKALITGNNLRNLKAYFAARYGLTIA